MKLKVSDVKKYKQKSGFISSNGIIPACDYLKFDDGFVSKTNMAEWFTGKLPFKGKMLINEKSLYDFISFTSEAEIEITQKDNRITITDGKKVDKISTIQFSDFPATPEPPAKYTKISEAMSKSIGVASNYIQNMEIPDHRSHVFASSTLVAASDGYIAYFDKYKKEPVKEMFLTKPVAAIVGSIGACKMETSGKWVFIQTEDESDTYSFIQSEYKFVDMSRFVDYNPKAKHFTVDKADVLNFANWCLASLRGRKYVHATMEIKDKKLLLTSVDVDYETSKEESVDVDAKASMNGSFDFNALSMANMLKHHPDDVVTFYHNEKNCHVVGESGAICIIQGLMTIQ